MSQIICLQMGQCGNQIATKFWQTISEEHCIDSIGNYYGKSQFQIQKIGAYYSETQQNRYVPRTILTDLQSGTLDSIKGSALGKLFKYDNYASLNKSTGNNWAKGYYTEGVQLIQYVLDTIRSQAEACDSLQGFQLSHSLGGGTGSGMGALLTARLKEEYPNKIIHNYSVVPSKKVSDTVVKPYNTLLSIHHLIQNINGSIILDNQALFNICSNTLKIPNPTYADLNHVVSLAMSGVTTSLRFPGQINSDLRKMDTNLVPFPRLHFFMVGQAPILAKQSTLPLQNLKINEIISGMLHARNMMCAVDPRHGRYLAGFVSFRGAIAANQIQWPYIIQGKNSSYFVQWIPNNVKAQIFDITLNSNNNNNNNKRSATFIGNLTAIQQLFRRLCEQFRLMFNRKAFLHWYTDEGMDQLQFGQALNNVEDLISEYQIWQDAVVDQYYQQSQ